MKRRALRALACAACWAMLLSSVVPARAGAPAAVPSVVPDASGNAPATLLEVEDRGPGWRAVARMDAEGSLDVALFRDGLPPTRCAHGWYWGLDASAREHPHLELSFARCACSEPPPAEGSLSAGSPVLRPDPMLWLDLRAVDKPVATLYLFRLRTPSVGVIRTLDMEGLKRFLAGHPWKENHSPCSN